MLQFQILKFEGKNYRHFCYNNWRHVGEHVERNWLSIRCSPCNKRSTCWSVLMCCKKKLLDLSYILKIYIYIFIPRSFLEINVCNQGKTMLTLYITAVEKQNKTNVKPLAFSSSVPFINPTDRAGCYYVSITCLLPLFDVAGGEKWREEMKNSVVYDMVVYGHVYRYRLTGRHIAEGNNLHEQLCENLKYRTESEFFGRSQQPTKTGRRGFLQSPYNHVHNFND